MSCQLLGAVKVVGRNERVLGYVEANKHAAGKYHRHNQSLYIPELLGHVVPAHGVLKGQVEEMGV